MDDITRISSEAPVQVRAAATIENLRDLEAELLGKKGSLSELKKGLAGLDPEGRREVGAALNVARESIAALIADRRAELEAEKRAVVLAAERLDLTERIGGPVRGSVHLVTQTWDRLVDVFVGMGFTVAEGPEVETDWYNFEALNIPAAHPARGMWDTLYVDLGDPETVLLRTHTSPVQIRVMTETPPPIYAVMPGRVYRRDTADATHMPVFHQIEGLVIDRNISFADMAGTLEAFTSAYFGGSIHSRLRPSYFPFTEPSAEYDINCVFCEGSGCRTCSHTGWLELGGCGMVHPNVLRNVGLDGEEWTGFAFGFGLDRLALMRHGVDDIREMYTGDVRFLEQFPS
ncbi:MAG: phenylalanine--tRNA ligase subunit alpha [Actinobacteria bacterium]|nr:phenylalanine--tRNA ligase subunit alpha [Actinomycetota bacterium]MTA76631.1 phenylalanine--tRNA ligase subunit alpha [Actinomycetota bacterium]